MALVVKDRVKQTTTTTGTGSIVLNGTVDGFQTFAAALANGDTTYYSIFEVSTNAYEIGLGTWNESTSTLARTTVLESSNSGSAINLTAQAEVFITYPAEKSVFLDSNGDVTLGNDLVVTGDFTVNGTTTTVNTTNSVVSDALIELGNGTSGTPSNDAGIVIERGSSDNAFIGYDESEDKFTVGTGSFTGASTGNLTISTGTLVANIEGNVTGNVTGNVSGSSGSTTGNAATATALQNARTIAGQSFDGTANITIAPTDLTGVSADAAEINILDGVTSTTAELNLLDGVTATTTELNYVDGVTSAIQTQLDAKLPLSGGTLTGNVTFGDGNKAIFGAGSDLQIFHDGSNSKILDGGTGNLHILADNETYIANAANGEYKARFITDGAVELYYDAAKKFETTSTGVDVTGNATFADNGKAIFGAGSDLQIYHDGFNSKIVDSGSGSLMINATDFYLINSGNTANFIRAIDGAQVDLYHNASIKLTTTSTGVDVTGTVNVPFKQVGTYTVSGINGGAVDTNGGDIVTGRIFFTGSSDSGTDLFGINNESNGLTVYNYVDGHYALYINNNNNIGIGTSAPSDELTVVGDQQGSDVTIRVQNSDLLNASSNSRLRLTTPYNEAYIAAYSGGGGSGYLVFANENAERMRIDSSGNVGIGMSSPSDFAIGNLVVGSGSGAEGITIYSGNAVGEEGIIRFADGTTGADQYQGQIKYEHNSNFMRFYTAATERMRIDSSGDVGIGTSTPTNYSTYRYLDIMGSATTTGGVIQLKTSDSSVNLSMYSYSGGGVFGTVTNHNLAFQTNNSVRMLIDASGNLLVGKTSGALGTAGSAFYNYGLVESVRDANKVMTLNRLTSGGDIIDFRKDGTTVGLIGTDGAQLYIMSRATDSGLIFGTNNIYPYRVSGVSDDTIDIGHPSYRFKDGYFSANLYANALIHDGDTNTKIEFNAADQISFETGGSQRAYINNSDFVVQSALKEDYDALSGTTPTIDVDAGGGFSLTMSGNTTFTFSSCTSGVITGFVLQLTGNGGTVTYPASVDWAGGTAPDAPANGETDILVFITRDGGTTWYGALSIDAAA